MCMLCTEIMKERMRLPELMSAVKELISIAKTPEDYEHLQVLLEAILEDIHNETQNQPYVFNYDYGY